MHVLCLVLVTVYAGQACHALLDYQGPPYTLDRARHGLPPAERADLREYSGRREYDVNYLKKLYKGIKNKRFSGADGALDSAGGVPHSPAAAPPPVRTHSHAHATKPSAPVSLAAPEPPAAPARLLHPPAGDGGDKEEDTGAPRRHLRPSSSFRFPAQVPDEHPCKRPPGEVGYIVTAPPNVCDLCPSENGKNPLDPCTVRMSPRTDRYRGAVRGSFVLHCTS